VSAVTVTPVVGLTAAELGRRLSRSERFADRLLEGLEELELVCHVGGAWRLSDRAERRFGPALRSLALESRRPA